MSVEGRGPDVGEWDVILPQKSLSTAKSRLRLPPGTRSKVAVAMLRDTIEAVRASASVRRIVGVFDSPGDADLLRSAEFDLSVVSTGTNLNEAIRQGEAATRDLNLGSRIAVLPTDLPGLNPNDLEQALFIAAGHPRTFVRDAVGTGTTLLTATENSPLHPCYGNNSANIHLRSGAVAVGHDLWSLRTDIDDLADLRRLGRSRLPRHVGRQLALRNVQRALHPIDAR